MSDPNVHVHPSSARLIRKTQALADAAEQFAERVTALPKGNTATAICVQMSFAFDKFERKPKRVFAIDISPAWLATLNTCIERWLATVTALLDSASG
jgi:hypothetical protein